MHEALEGRYIRCIKATLAVFVLLWSPPLWAEDAAYRAVSAPTAKTLLLEDGRVVRLAAIQAPNSARDGRGRDEPLARQAQARLEELAQGGEVRLRALKNSPDRHGRVVAWAEDAEGRLLQAEMLRAGMAWAYTFPDTREMAATLRAAEAEAEAAGRGVWAEPAYAVLTPEGAERHAGAFRLVEGMVRQVTETRNRWYLNFGEDWKTDFTLSIERGSMRHFDPAWLRALEGRTVRARGWLFRMNGPAMELTHPEQLEIRE